MSSKYDVIPGIQGVIKGVRKIQDRGRIQIPKYVRTTLNLMEGDNIYWVEGLDGRFYICKAVKLK